MKRRMLVSIVAAAACLAAAPAAPALGSSGFTLNLSAPEPAVVGQPMVLQVTGTVPQHVLDFAYWFSLSAIPTSVTTTCPDDHFVAMQLATSTGGSIVVLVQREPADAAGNFTIPVGVTPSAPGSVLLCGYTDDGETHTLARASMVLNIGSGSSSQGRSGRPSPPVEAVQGIRSCLALLTPSQARGCIRGAIKRANARCRRLRSRPARTRCLRAVRRVSTGNGKRRRG
jgi:hypothetical protein